MRILYAYPNTRIVYTLVGETNKGLEALTVGRVGSGPINLINNVHWAVLSWLGVEVCPKKEQFGRGFDSLALTRPCIAGVMADV